MKLKAIIAGILISGSVMAQNIAVFSEGTNLYRSGTIIASNFVGNTFAPAYGVFKIASTPFKVAESSTVTNGTITAGSVTNTFTEDGDYYTVQETGKFEIYFLFSNALAMNPREVTFHGRYEGNPSHEVIAEISNVTATTWDSMLPSPADIPSGSTDDTYKWEFPAPETNYITASGVSMFRFRHVDNAVSSHYMYMDYLAMTYADVIIPTAGVWMAFSGVSIDAQLNTIMDTTNATVTTIDAGEYRTGWYASFTGSSNTIFTIRAVTNGAPTDIEMWRSIGGEPAIGSASAFGYERQAAGTTNGWELRSDRDNSWFTLVNGHAEVKKVSN